MPQKKNIKLLIVWIILLAITISVGIFRPSANKLDIDKEYFALKEKVNDLNRITITGANTNILLYKEGRQWSLNNELTADPSKINDLLGVLSEVSVRRKAATNIQEKISSSVSSNYDVSLFTGDVLVQSFEVTENDQGTLTYFIDDIAYVVSIPGYNYHIADIFTLTSAEWRSPYVFASNWTTLDKMQINYPQKQEYDFEIIYDNLGYFIPSVPQLDTAAMYDYMQQISFLQVQSYLPAVDTISRPSDLNITIKDVGDQQMILDFYIYDSKILGLINNEEWGIFDRNQVKSLLKSSTDFSRDRVQ